MPYILESMYGMECNLSMFCLVSYYKTSHSSNLGMPTSYFKLSDLQIFYPLPSIHCPVLPVSRCDDVTQTTLPPLNTTTLSAYAPNTCHHTFQNHHPIYSRTTHPIQTTKNKYHRKEGRGNNMIG